MQSSTSSLQQAKLASQSEWTVKDAHWLFKRHEPIAIVLETKAVLENGFCSWIVFLVNAPALYAKTKEDAISMAERYYALRT
jgi:hypothetical protein